MRKIIAIFIAAAIIMTALPAAAEQLDVNAKSAVLMESSTGRILYESNPDEKLPIASVTKIMTMLIIMEAVDSGKISLDDMVTASERAKSMGGSTMFLDTGEQLSVNDMLKGIAVASANDGAVAMAEYIAGSEQGFVEMMNQKAEELGMNNTHFVNTNGLDADDHYSSARDVAVMSRELIQHKKIFDYTTIWMDTLRGGKFQLANTNKMIRFYKGANGLKTGSTSKALCCLSATAERDGMQLIAVVLGAPTSKERFGGASALLDYGFAKYEVSAPVKENEVIAEVNIHKGVESFVNAIAKDGFSALSEKGGGSAIEKNIIIDESINAPVKSGDVLGTVELIQNGNVIGSVELIAEKSVDKKGIRIFMSEILKSWFMESSRDQADNSEDTTESDMAETTI